MTIVKQTGDGKKLDTPASASEGVTAPIHAHGGYGNAAVLAPHDSTDFANEIQALYVGGTGNITGVLPDDTTVLISAIPVGTILPIRLKRINATGTTATLLVGFW